MRKQYSKIIFLFVGFVCIFTNPLDAQLISGKILNENNEPIPYATIFIQEAKTGTISNADGNFNIHLTPGFYHLRTRSLGYIQTENEIQITADTLILNIILQRQDFEIKEVKIFPGNEDPAYFIIRRAISKAQFYREKIIHYKADLYLKSNFTFTNIPRLYQNKMQINDKKLKEVFKENVTYVIESQNTISYNYPNKYEQKVIYKKSSLDGFDDPPVMGLMTSSFYDERPNQVISPLSSLALKHYKFQYEGFISIGNRDVFKIKVSPKRNSDELVEGYIYIVDKLWCIYNLDFSTHFEFFDYRIKQQYENLGNENWLPVSHIIDGQLGMLGLRANFYYGASVKYDSIVDNSLPNEKITSSLTTPPVSATSRKVGEKEKVFKTKVVQITDKEELTNNDVRKVARLHRKILKEQYKDSTIVASNYNQYNIDDQKDSLNTDVSWDTIRTIPLLPNEIESYKLADSITSLEKMEIDSITEGKKENKLFSKILTGHYDLSKDSLIRLGYNGLISPKNFAFNSVDGYKYKQKFELRLNPDSGKYIFIIPEMGFAFNRKTVFGSINGHFRNILANGNTFGFGFGKESRDFKPSQLGIQPFINSISSWFFGENYMKLYETQFLEFNISQRIKKNFTLSAAIENNHFFPLKNNIEYSLSDNKEYSQNIPKGFIEDYPELLQQNDFSYSIQLNYKKQQQKPWLEKSQFLFMNDFYEFNLIYNQGVNDIFSSNSDFSHIDFSFQQQANISPSSGIDWKINAGYFFNSEQMHFSKFKHFNTSEILVPFKSFTHTFQLINDYEFSTNSSYLNIGAEFRTEYLLMRYLSVLNKRTWSESIHLNYLSTNKLNNYWELGYSLNSLFFIGNIGVFSGFNRGRIESVAVKISISGNN